MSAPEAVDACAKVILRQHQQQAARKAYDAKVLAVYATDTHNPPGDASLAVRLVEETVRDAVILEAQFYEKQAQMYQAALDAIEAGA